MRRSLLVLAALLAVLPLGGRARAEDPVSAPTPAVSAALEELASPAERERRAAVETLIAQLPGSRQAVLDALSSAAPEAKLHLVEVLAADGSLPAIRGLLAAMNRDDEILAARIRRTLARDERATQHVLEAWARDPDLRNGPSGDVAPGTRALEKLLRRAEAERLFLSRKSRTGSTGSYRGQYDALKPYREEALDICVGLITDRALPEPGVVTAGGFTFLRPSPVHIDVSELRSMAAHAFSELATPRDMTHLFTLSQYLLGLKRRLAMLEDFVELGDVLGQYGDLLVTLYLISPDRYRAYLDEFLRQLEYESEWQRVIPSTFRPLILLRIGRHAEAVAEFEEALRFGTTRSEAGAHYNLACAYAQWGEETEPGPAREAMLEKAIRHLEWAVDNRWSDIGWMEEDRDLEPLRGTARYESLIERVRQELRLPDED